jgi:hypothetical protein
MFVVWDLTAGHAVRRIGGMSPGVFSLAFSPDGKRMSSAGSWAKTMSASTRARMRPPPRLGRPRVRA